MRDEKGKKINNRRTSWNKREDVRNNYQEIIRLFVEENKTWKEISNIFNCSPTLIGNLLKKSNINTSRKGKEFSKEHRKNLRLTHLGKKQSNKTIEKRRKKMIGHIILKETRTKIKESNLKTYSNPELIERLSKMKIGELNPMFGKKTTKETKNKRIETKKKNGTLNPTQKTKNKISSSIKKLWGTIDYASKTLQALYNRPTKYEKKISELCIENSLPFIYTGDGTFLIGHKNPDFVNKKQKIAIEVYYSYYKIRDYGSCEEYEKRRSEYFAKYGYKTIFIKDNEINSKSWKEVCLNKIQEKII